MDNQSLNTPSNNQSVQSVSATGTGVNGGGVDIKTTKNVFWRQKKWLLLLLAVTAGAVAIATKVFHIPFAFHQQVKPAVTLNQPDAWIHSQNLALLPHDILQVPLLKDVLTEEFVYFYQQDEDWLSLQGAMRRISFDHQLQWSDSLLKNVAAAPADIFLWHDDSHALRYWAMSLERDSFTSIAQKLAELKLTADKQLTQVGSIKIDGDTVPVLKIALSARRQMVLAAHQKRVVLLSNIDMASTAEDGTLTDEATTLLERLLANDNNTRSKVVAEWETANKAQPVAQTKHSILLSNRFFALGYAPFIPNMRALRFDFNDTTWQTVANINTAKLDSKIWSYLPANAAFCISTPIDWEQVQKAVGNAQNFDSPPKLASIFAPTGAACWYSDEHDNIAEPLLVGLVDSTLDSGTQNKALAALFDWGIATNKDYLKDLRALQRKQRQLARSLESAKDYVKQVKAEKIDSKLKGDDRDAAKKDLNERIDAAKKSVDDAKQAQKEIEPQIEAALTAIKQPAIDAQKILQTQDADSTLLMRAVPVISSADANKKVLESNPVLAFNKQVVYFATRQDLVERGLKTQQKRYPNLQESTPLLNSTAQHMLFVNPAKLAQLLQQTGQDALPQTSQTRLRAAFDYHMPHRFAVMAKHPAFSLAIDSPIAKDDQLWHPLVWHQVGK